MKSRKKKRLLCGVLSLIMMCALVIPVANVSAEQDRVVYSIELDDIGNSNRESGDSFSLKTKIRTRIGYGSWDWHYASKGEVTYTSSNPYVAKINSNETITMMSVGETTITATHIDNTGKRYTSEKTIAVKDNKKFSDSRTWPLEYLDNTFTKESNGTVRCYDRNGKPIVNQFACDGIYTYYFQLDGTAMQDRLTYHPDGVHVIYFDEWGHEVFSDFAHVKRAIAGNAVDDYCFFNVYGYMYVNVLTYDKNGRELYYANAYGVLERDKWFQFDPAVMWADGTPAYGVGGQYGKANSDGTLVTNRHTSDWQGRKCYLQGNGVAAY